MSVAGDWQSHRPCDPAVMEQITLGLDGDLLAAAMIGSSERLQCPFQELRERSVHVLEIGKGRDRHLMIDVGWQLLGPRTLDGDACRALKEKAEADLKSYRNSGVESRGNTESNYRHLMAAYGKLSDELDARQIRQDAEQLANPAGASVHESPTRVLLGSNALRKRST
jgi:hypothetical protein